MKLIVLSALLLPAVLMAQGQQPAVRINPPQGFGAQHSSELLPDNYQITLNITDKDGAPLEISLVVASSQFTTMLGEQNLSFQNLSFGGNVKVEEAGGIVIAYDLDWQTPVGVAGSTQYLPSRMHGSVRLKLGEEVQIIRAGTRSARLSIQKLDAVKGKVK